MLTIHKASAGSGKTFTLAYEYIKLLLGEKTEGGNYRLARGRGRHRAILAITFTNKATDEMKRRIVRELGLLAGIVDGKSDYMPKLTADLNTSPEHIAEAAGEALDSLLDDFTGFNVSTIDSFFQTVLRTFAREAELTGNYEVELDDKNAVAIGVGEMLSAINRSTDRELRSDPQKRALTGWLTRYMRALVAEGKNFNIFNRRSPLTADLITFVHSAVSESYKLNADIIDAYLADPGKLLTFVNALDEAGKGLKETLKAEAAAAIATLEAEGALPLMNHHLRNNFLNWPDGDFHLTATSLAAIDNPEKRFAKGKDGSARAHQVIADTIRRVVAVGGVIAFYSLLQKNSYNLGLLGEVNRRVAELQADNNAILLRDTGDILHRIISEEEAPFIYERLGVRLRHFLIDEFQDTSRLQWINLSSLVAESLSHDYDDLIIGDEKQSIYRFRNSDPELLVKVVPGEFPGRTLLRGKTPAENTNYRSAAHIVAANNSIFLRMAAATGLSEVYSGVVQLIKKKKLPGFVEIAPYDEPEEALAMMTAAIRRQLASGYRQADIAILVKDHVTAARIIDHLLACKTTIPEFAGLQVMSEDSLVIGSAPSVQLILAVLHYLDVSRTGPGHTADRSRVTSEHLGSRFRYYRSQGHSVAESIELAFSANDNLDSLIMEAAEMECISLPSFVERVITRCLTPEALSRENVYISAFQDLVTDFCDRPSADLHSFLVWWEETGSRRSLDAPSQVDALRVMTIHKSKGLEFPCVHVPLVNWQLDKGGRLVWFDIRPSAVGSGTFPSELFPEGCVPPFFPLATSAALADTPVGQQYAEAHEKEVTDTVNLTYVAFTRAGRELTVSYSPKSNVGALIAEALTGATRAWADTVAPEPGVLAPLADHLDNSSEAPKLAYGEPTQPESSDSSDAPVAMPPYYAYDNDHIWALSRIDDLDQMARPRREGIILHTIMSGLRSAADLRKAMLRAVTRGLVTPAEAPEIEAMLARALSQEEVRPWFEGFTRLLRERPLTGTDRSGHERNYRPDRVVWTADGTIAVVDYKFGEEHPGKYIPQVRGYLANLRAIYPGATVRGYLWYPRTGAIHPV